MTHNLAL